MANPTLSSDRLTLFHALLSGADRSPRARLTRTALRPLAGLYGAVIRGYRALYDRGVLRAKRLPCRMIAVGNLTVGGTGKSTTTRWLAQLLFECGHRVAILSYGYHGRAGHGDRVTVVSDGRSIRVPVEESGDEPWMLADVLPGVPVLIGPRRVLSAERAVREFGTEVCLLDDGFQYWRVEKDLEIVLIDAGCPFGYGYLLPRGLLREPASALSRADVILLMNAQHLAEEDRARLTQRLRRLAPQALMCEGFHAPSALRDLFSGEERPLDWIRGLRVVALSSLGNPESFERTLQELGAREVVARRFPNHHLYSGAEARAAITRTSAIDAVVTTAKDAPKLRRALGGEGDVVGAGGEVYLLDVELRLTSGERALADRVLRLVGAGSETGYQTA